MSVPTANISLGEHLRPKFGVYAVHAGGLSASRIKLAGRGQYRRAANGGWH